MVAGIHNRNVSPAGGIVLTADGIAVTNYHVVEQDNTALVAMTSDQRVVPVKAVLAASKQYDIAIIQLDGKGFTPLPLTSGAQAGNDIFALTHPSGHFYYAEPRDHFPAGDERAQPDGGRSAVGGNHG